MRYLLLYALLLFLSFGCGANAPEASVGFHTAYFYDQTDERNETVIHDLRQHLLFVNSAQGCVALHGDEADALDRARRFCRSLTFFGYADWRLPTLEEIQSFSRHMDAEGLVPFFTFPECKRVVGLKSDGTLGAIHTHNVMPKFEETPLKLPAGIRCVRTDEP